MPQTAAAASAQHYEPHSVKGLCVLSISPGREDGAAGAGATDPRPTAVTVSCPVSLGPELSWVALVPTSAGCIWRRGGPELSPEQGEHTQPHLHAGSLAMLD